ncbi:hypothetical protein FGO68_gene14690 [Halteria grandinella]|uniref:Uncharacterized protein n=1 Tax=Halteria grandinella TaxID=5974 RepID=A0A8J8NHJ9_HALGN|nr:hypothetical protein FGO68_gene14690 [Halteria grandinella]
MSTMELTLPQVLATPSYGFLVPIFLRYAFSISYSLFALLANLPHILIRLQYANLLTIGLYIPIDIYLVFVPYNELQDVVLLTVVLLYTFYVGVGGTAVAAYFSSEFDDFVNFLWIFAGVVNMFIELSSIVIKINIANQ